MHRKSSFAKAHPYSTRLPVNSAEHLSGGRTTPVFGRSVSTFCSSPYLACTGVAPTLSHMLRPCFQALSFLLGHTLCLLVLFSGGCIVCCMEDSPGYDWRILATATLLKPGSHHGLHRRSPETLDKLPCFHSGWWVGYKSNISSFILFLTIGVV